MPGLSRLDETLDFQLHRINFPESLRGQWTTAIYGATAAEGITLAVVPLRVLAEHDGVLDQLERRGLDIAGPAWR